MADKNIRKLNSAEYDIEYLVCSMNDEGELRKVDIDILIKIFGVRLGILDADGYTNLFYDNQFSNYPNVNVYAWNNTNNNSNGWPGQPMTYLRNNIWYYRFKNDNNFDKCLFGNGLDGGVASGNQTPDYWLAHNHVYDNTSDCGKISDDYIASVITMPSSLEFTDNDIVVVDRDIPFLLK